jgi:hypothetical protein
MAAKQGPIILFCTPHKIKWILLVSVMLSHSLLWTHHRCSLLYGMRCPARTHRCKRF